MYRVSYMSGGAGFLPSTVSRIPWKYAGPQKLKFQLPTSDVQWISFRENISDIPPTAKTVLLETFTATRRFHATLSRIFLKLCNFRLPEFSPNCPWPDPEPFRKVNRPAHIGVLSQTEASLHTIGNRKTYNEEFDRSEIPIDQHFFSHLAWPVPTCHWSQKTSFS